MSITPIEKVLYTAKAHTTGGREGGASHTSDGRLDVKLSVPGTPGAGTNPEQLFAVGWSACFLSALKIVAGRMKVKLPADLAIDPEVDLGMAPEASEYSGRGVLITLPIRVVHMKPSFDASMGPSTV